jgi:hypothetical protein
MACQIKRKDNGTIDTVLAPNGKPSVLYNSLVNAIASSEVTRNVIQSDPYVSSVMDSVYVMDNTAEELALAAWSKAYTVDFIDSFGNWKEDKLPNTDSNGEPTINMLFPEIADTGVKPGVSELFESNPELANVGTQEQYSAYLDQVFPDSKVKDIMYHGSDKTFNKFSKEFARADRPYFYFSFAEEANMYKEARGGSYIYPVILNVKNYATGYTPDELEIDTVNNLIKQGYDAVAGRGWTTREEVAVFEPEQIHILGTPQDIEGFKRFVSKPTQSVRLFSSEEYSKNTRAYVEEVERVTRLIENKLKIKEKSFVGKTTDKFVEKQDYLNDVLKQLLNNIGLPNTITSLEELKAGLQDGTILKYIQKEYDFYKQKTIKTKGNLNTLNSNVRVLNRFLKSLDINAYSIEQQELIRKSFPALFEDLGRYKSKAQALSYYKQVVNTPKFLNKALNLQYVKTQYFTAQSKLNKFENLLNYNTLSPEDFQYRIYKVVENELDRRSEFFDSNKMQAVVLAEKEKIAKQTYEKSVKGLLERFSKNENTVSGKIAKVFLEHPNTLNAIKAENINKTIFGFAGGEWKGDGTLNVNFKDEQSLKHILLHELTHHFTVPYVFTYLKNHSNIDKYVGFSERFPSEEDLKESIEYSVKELTRQEVDSISKLEDIYIHVLNLHKQGKIQFTNREFSANPEYGLENLYEFISEVISNPYFAAEIAKQPGLFNKKSNLLKDIIYAIFKMFGINNNNSLLEDVYNLFEDSFLYKDEKYNFKSLVESKSSFKYNLPQVQQSISDEWTNVKNNCPKLI